MRKRLACFFRWLAQWLDPIAPTVPLVARDVLDAAIQAVSLAQQTAHTSHFKRAMAFKALRHERPDARRRDLSLAIEMALREIAP
jgi:hypothetical protein